MLQITSSWLQYIYSKCHCIYWEASRVDVGILLSSRQHLQQQAPSLCAVRHLRTSSACRSDVIAAPPLDGAPKQYSPKIQQLVNDIASLTLLEVSDLNELLKVCLYALACLKSKPRRTRFVESKFGAVFILVAENFEHSGCRDAADGGSSSACRPGNFPPHHPISFSTRGAFFSIRFYKSDCLLFLLVYTYMQRYIPPLPT